MRVVLGSDHAGFSLKEDLGSYLPRLGHEVVDAGTTAPHPWTTPTMPKRSGWPCAKAGPTAAS